MPTAPKVVDGANNGGHAEALRKPEPQSSLSEVSKTKYSLDGIDDGNIANNDLYDETYHNHDNGHTKHDQRDMYRMGKIQELRVR